MPSLVSERATLGEPASTGYSKTSRRQYQACDQCRKSRRACDAGTLRVVNFPFREDEQGETASSTSEACSNCARTSKKCTFDWLRELPLQGLPKGVKRKLESTGVAEVTTNLAAGPKFHISYSNGHPASDPSTLPQLAPASNALRSMHESGQLGLIHQYQSLPENEPPGKRINYYSESPEMQCLGHINENLDVPLILPVSNDPTLITSLPYVPDAVFRAPPLLERSTSQGQWKPPMFSCHDTPSTSPISNPNESSNEASKIDSSPSLTSISSVPVCEEDVPQRISSKILTQAGLLGENPGTVATNRAKEKLEHQYERPIDSNRYSNGKRRNSAPLSSSQVRFADTAMKAMIATGLLRIYHDSFENSLSCWVTERNCPYEIELRELRSRAGLASNPEETPVHLRDNRVFSRVSHLDSAFARLRGRELSQAESRSATKALNAAIMAFASQWSHSSHNAFWRAKDGSQAHQTQSQRLLFQPESPDAPLLSNECERVIQRTLWHDAQTAIQATSEIDSFKVILAYMIFALTQRPIGTKSKLTEEVQTSPTDDVLGSRRGSENASTYNDYDQGTDSVIDITANEDWDPFYTQNGALPSPPIYLESAVRNLFSWRRKIERYRQFRSKSENRNRGCMAALALKDQQTFNLLFWLGVMCDTTSSAISNRPLVISDEDCAMIRESFEDVEDVSSGQDDLNIPFKKEQGDDSGKLWGDYLLNFRWAGPRSTQARWPCKFDDAAFVLQEAIPVKVLLFRKVATLQTLAYRRTPAHQLEKCIKDAFSVYRHWNSTYGQFMIDCVNDHNSLPPHVQSWYVILDGHWHYGCLLLADMISQIDREGKTMESPRALRANCHIIRELRQDNGLAIAKIAQASISEHRPSVPDKSEFHFACNGSAILTEPWTDILVRAMGSACKIFINFLSVWDDPADADHEWLHATNSYQNLYSHAEVCIHGMTLLGRKSDAANRTAETFWARLRSVCLGKRASASDVDA